LPTSPKPAIRLNNECNNEHMRQLGSADSPDFVPE